MAFIKIQSGSKKGQRIDVDRDEVIVGRAADNVVVLEDGSVSGKHCKITREGRRFTLQDLDSTNGTKLNDVNVREHQLSAGDVISAGSVQLLFDGDDIEDYKPAGGAEEQPAQPTMKLPATGKAQTAPAFDARKSRKWVGVTLAVLAAALIVALIAVFLSILFGE